MSTMDRECVSLLPRVCEVLADSGRSLHDDTSLEKLLDWFTELTKTDDGGSLLESCPCLLEFISTVVYNTASDPGVLSFTLKLTGLMAARENGFKILQESSVLDLVFNMQHWQEAGLWDDPCMRIGWIQGLQSMLQHPKAFNFIQPLLRLQSDTSLFVASAANQMLAHVLLHFQPPASTRSDGIDRKDGNDMQTCAPITAVTMETSGEYTAVVMALSEYLKDVQLLKLLALLLAQARPPLRDTLLRTVADSLEVLVTTAYAQLTLPLMDVILQCNNVTVFLSLSLSFHQPADVLPCPPGLIVTAVLTLLTICSGHTSLSSEVFRNVIGSGKVQKCALEALTALTKEKANEVFTVLLQYLANPDSDPTVSLHVYSSSINKTVNLIEVVKKRVCDMRWEVRDSTVEFLGKVAGVRKQPEEVADRSEDLMISTSCTTPLLKEALQDPESYVRASAISALAQTLTHSWRQGAALTQEQVGSNLKQLLETLSKDTEGFARRAVIQYFIAWFSSSSSHSPPSSSSTSSSSLLMNSVRSVLSLGSADLDWEVKVHTLELARLLLDEALSGQRGYRKNLAAVLNTLVELGVISALLSGLVDCDRPVALKACQLLITLRDTACPLSLGALDATAAIATLARVSCELPSWGWGQEIKKILEMKRSDWPNGVSVAAQRSFSSVDDDDTEEVGTKGAHSVCVSVCKVLRSLGLDERLHVLTQSSDHIHNSPLSLLQDLLTASAACAHTDTQPGQEVIVDCY
uniref:BRCA1-associated ATM activator 1 n=1 Tax=Anabas testudineus TaxID=64144 RepID=A0A7N6B5P6_ANATE